MMTMLSMMMMVGCCGDTDDGFGLVAADQCSIKMEASNHKSVVTQQKPLAIQPFSGVEQILDSIVKHVAVRDAFPW